jgi:hypothetical protein
LVRLFLRPKKYRQPAVIFCPPAGLSKKTASKNASDITLERFPVCAENHLALPSYHRFHQVVLRHNDSHFGYQALPAIIRGNVEASGHSFLK